MHDITQLSSQLGDLVKRNRLYIPGGISSANRAVDPPIAFTRGEGAYIWDTDGKKYIDYHAGFAPFFLGHNFSTINEAVIRSLGDGDSLFGAGLSVIEGELAELVCNTIGHIDKVVLLNTGSEATSLAIRLSRAVTGRKHFIVMQGSYNGNHDELACNVMNTLDEIGPRVSPGEYPIMPIGAGTTIRDTRYVHAINFNDLESVEYVCRRNPIAALIVEPVLQNIGVVRPISGYLEGLRDMASKFGFVLIFDEVKTGFRHAIGGYSEVSGVIPDLAVYGKAIANGFPLALLGGREQFMGYLNHSEPAKRPFLAGTYNGHPVSVTAAIATIQYLIQNKETIYPKVEALGQRLELGMREIFGAHKIPACVTREGSAFSYYLMPEPPRDLHDIVEKHDSKNDLALRRALIELGVFFMPVPTKQCSISARHTIDDIDYTLEQFDRALHTVHTSFS